MSPHASSFVEVADRVWLARHEWFDVNVALVEGADGLAVIDTNTSLSRGRGTLEAVARISSLPVRFAINTHVHFDHTFGNRAFVAAGAELVAHEDAAAALPAHADEVARSAADDLEKEPAQEPRLAELVETVAAGIPMPTTTFSSIKVLDLGDRMIELVHPGRGHTAGDLVVRVPEADTVLAGDVIEEARGAVPGFGDDCFPADWPTSLDVVLGLLTSGSVVVPGHGKPVDRDFVEDQRNGIAIVAENIRELASRGVPASEALAAGEWPWPREQLAAAVRRGYEQLPRGARQLPRA